MAALLCGAVGLELAWHYPLSGPVAVALWLAVALMSAVAWCRHRSSCWRRWRCGLAPLTGWITFEEMDLLVTAVVSGGNLGFAFWAGAPRAGACLAPRPGLPGGHLGLIVLLAPVRCTASGAACGTRGLAIGWFQGLPRAMNAVRNSKAIFLALLLLPLWVETARMQPRRFTRCAAGATWCWPWWPQHWRLWGACGLHRLAGLLQRLPHHGFVLGDTCGRRRAGRLPGDDLAFAVLTLLRTRSPAYFVACWAWCCWRPMPA